MCASPDTRRATAEIDFDESGPEGFKIGDRSIHQFWHLFSSHFRSVFLAPHRRPDSGRVAWSWREPVEKRPVTATELAEVRRRLSEAGASLAGEFGGLARDDRAASALERQVREIVTEIAGQLVGHRDATLAAFVCRTDVGLMVHSWGAAVGAEPWCPDTHPGEISGTVFVGTSALAAATVILTTPEGLAAAQTKSDRDGGFRFPGVAPGNYRVKVVGRTDFPDDGVALTMERESITGLNLRGMGGETSAVPVAPLSPAEQVTPRYRRKATLLVALLLIVGVSGGLWRYRRHSAGDATSPGTHDSGWQAATGKLAEGPKTALSGDDRKIGGEGAWSSLSAARKIPKLLPRHSEHGEWATKESDRIPLQSDDSRLSDSGSTGKESMPDSTKKADPNAGEPPEPKSSEHERSPFQLKDQEPDKDTDDLEGGAPEGDEIRDAKNRPAKMASSKPAPKRPAVSGEGAMPVEESPADKASSGREGNPTDPAAASASTGGRKSGKLAGARSPASSTTGASAPDVAPESDAAEQNAEASAAEASPAAISSKSSSGNKAVGGHNGGAAQGSDPAKTALTSNSGTATGAADGAVATEGAANKNTPPSQSKQKPVPVPSPLEQSQRPNPADEPESAATGADAAKAVKKTTKAPASVGERKANPVASGVGATPLRGDSDSAPATAQPLSAEIPSSRESKNAAKKKLPTAASEKTEGPREDSPENLPALPAGMASGRTSESTAGPLMQLGRIHASAWKARLVRDSILPTRPMTAADEEVVEAMRKEILRQRTAQMPAAFRQPRVQNGLAVELSAALAAQPGPLRWRDALGREPAGALVRGSHAELGWQDDASPRNEDFMLVNAAGRELARVSFDQTGTARLKLIPDAHAWYWIGVERSPEDSFEWQLAKGEPVPTSWPRDDRWRENRGQRVDIPLDTLTTQMGNYDIALVDPATGWSLEGRVGFGAK